MTGLPLFFNTAGMCDVSDPIKLIDRDLTDPLNPVFKLICIVHNGPPTRVTWYRDGIKVPDDSNHTVTRTVTDMCRSIYEIILTVKGNEPGNYKCCVANARGGDCSQELPLEGIIHHKIYYK